MTISWDANRSEVPTLLDAIGRTPLVRLRRVAPEGVELLAKVEWYGPTGSVKDRIYAAMLTKAEERGDLRPGMTIIECTTGNAGIACSAVAAIKGYACTIVMPEGMSNERKRMIAAYGAELVLTPGAGTDIDLALARMREIVAADPDRYFFPGEFENPDNPQAQLASGEEIWEQAAGRVDAVVGAQGTGGWITGVARALKAHDPDVLAFAVEPSECPLDLASSAGGPTACPASATASSRPTSICRAWTASSPPRPTRRWKRRGASRARRDCCVVLPRASTSQRRTRWRRRTRNCAGS